MKSYKRLGRLLTALAFVPGPALAEPPGMRTFKSASGKTTIRIIQGDGWERAGYRIGDYKQIDGSGGYLVNTGQEHPMGFYTQFYDTSGQERCVGRMHIFIDDSGRPYASRATWTVDGTVPGSRCSTVGQTFKLRMEQVSSSEVNPAAPTGARAQPPNQKQCAAALATGSSMLQEGRKLEVSVRSRDISQTYPDHPAGRPREYLFTMKGPATASIFNSPKLLQSVGAGIFANCSSVGTVTFALANSGWMSSLGLMPGGQVEFFQCLEARRDTAGRRLKWGQQYCNL